MSVRKCQVGKAQICKPLVRHRLCRHDVAGVVLALSVANAITPKDEGRISGEQVVGTPQLEPDALAMRHGRWLELLRDGFAGIHDWGKTVPSPRGL